jgi:hypothetical protein
MTGHQGVDALIGFAVALLLASLLAIAALARERPKGRQLEAAYRRFSPSGPLPGRNRRPRLNVLVAVLVILNVVWLGFLLSRALAERTVESAVPQNRVSGGVPSSASPSPAAAPRSGSAEGATIQVKKVVDSARPFQTVRIQGTYRGGANTVLRVQRWEAGKWVSSPLPTKTDQSGQFTTHVEFGPGSYRLRMLDPESGVASRTFVLLIKGWPHLAISH